MWSARSGVHPARPGEPPRTNDIDLDERAETLARAAKGRNAGHTGSSISYPYPAIKPCVATTARNCRWIIGTWSLPIGQFVRSLIFKSAGRASPVPSVLKAPMMA